MFTSVNQIQVSGAPFFEAKVVEIDGQSYSLNDFERHFVFGDFDRSSKKPPPRSLDPRAHFALVCAAVGCPPLMSRAYTADSLDAQLDHVTREALSSPTHLKWDPDTRRLDASSVFNWYEADFGGRDKAFAFLKRYAPPQVSADLMAKHVAAITFTIPWDWKLNQSLIKDS
jgi:hypothetical protein